jgi:hypothetical protein
MRNLNHKYYLYAIGLFIVTSITALWSWNTISELFNLPQAQYKHVLAAFVLFLTLRWALFPSYRAINHKFGGDHEHPNH